MKTLLVVDDDPAVREAFREFLEGQGFVVHVAADAHEAVSKLGATVFDAVLTDIVMPGGGWAVIEHVQANHPQTPVIVVSAYEPDAGYVGTPAAFAQLTKPVAPAEIVSVLQRACERGQ